MAGISPNDRVPCEKVTRNPKCARCRNHGLVVPLKGHSGKCPFKPCVCWKCSLIAERTKILASQRRIKTENPNESPRADRPEHSSNGVNATKAPVQRADGKTYTELQAPDPGPGHCEPKTGLNPPGDPPHFPGEYIITEAIPRQFFPGEVFAMPVPMYPHYPDRYMYPAVLVTLRQPAPHLGFLSPTPTALSHLLETNESGVHMPCYSPCPTLPVLRDEHGPKLQEHLQSHMEEEQGIDKVPHDQAGHTSESHVHGKQDSEVVPADGLSSNITA